jgi:hypothetical protein
VEQARSMAHPWCRGRRRDAHVEAMDHLGGLEVAVEAEAAAVGAQMGALIATAEEGVGEAMAAVAVAVAAMVAVEEGEEETAVGVAEGVEVEEEAAVVVEAAAVEVVEVAVAMAGPR